MAKKKKGKLEGILDRNIPPVGIQDLKEIIKLKIESKEFTSLMIVGNHGIGKSEAVLQAAEMVGYRVVDKRLSCMEVGDLVGIPLADAGGTETIWLKPDWLPIKGEEKHEKTILFFDEYMRANRDIKNASMQLILDGKLNGWTLPADCLVVSCINDGEEYDMVGGLDPAQIDRFQVFELAPSHEEWMAWATKTVEVEGNKRQRVNSYITTFLKSNHEYLDAPDFAEDQVEKVNKFQSRRSWVKLSDIVYAIGKKPNGKHNALVSSYVGCDAATNFIAHCDKVIESIPAKDVLTGKDVFTGKEEYWEDITRCSKTIYEIVDCVKAKSVDAKGMNLQKSNVSKKEFGYLSDFVRKLAAINPEPAALYWIKLKDAASVQDIYEQMVMAHDLAETLYKLFPDTQKKIEEIQKTIKENK